MNKLIPLIFLLIFLSACSAAPQPTVKPVTSSTLASGYPAPDQQTPEQVSGYPVPANGKPTLIPASPTNTVNPSLGQVKGVFQMENRPTMPYVLYLAPTVKDSNGREIVVKFDRGTAILAEPDQKTGAFHFVNVPSGRYGLIYDAISNAYLMDAPDKGETLLITVNGNETIDLGVLKYENPPSQ